MEFLRLLGQRRFGPFFATQFLGAFNDNLLKNFLTLLFTFRIASESESGVLTNMAAGLFILPFFLFSTLAGQLADKYDQSRLIRMIKAAEVGIMLMGSVATEETTLRATPELWGHTREVKELELLFLEMPLLQRWNVAQRKDVLAQIDSTFVATLTEKEPGDREHWRRQYYGVELTCEATDEVLEQLKAKRPKDCLNLTPR